MSILNERSKQSADEPMMHKMAFTNLPWKNWTTACVIGNAKKLSTIELKQKRCDCTIILYCARWCSALILPVCHFSPLHTSHEATLCNCIKSCSYWYRGC
jgi:hypothetical protein